MNPQFELADGSIVGTGLQTPTRLTASFPLYENAGPLLTMDQIREIARSGLMAGRKRFDSGWIKNQRSHGSCNGFAQAAALQRARVRRGLARVNLSGAYAYSLINGGRDDGSLLDEGMLKCMSQGIATEETVPWDKIYPRLYDRAKADAEAAHYRGFECYATREEIALLSGLALGFDGVVALDANSAYMRLDADGVAGSGGGPGNHALCVDGIAWSERRQTVLIDQPGSWGTAYGEQGRCFLTWRDHLARTTQYHQFYLIRSTTDGPSDGPPAIS